MLWKICSLYGIASWEENTVLHNYGQLRPHSIKLLFNNNCHYSANGHSNAMVLRAYISSRNMFLVAKFDDIWPFLILSKELREQYAAACEWQHPCLVVYKSLKWVDQWFSFMPLQKIATKQFFENKFWYLASRLQILFSICHHYTSTITNSNPQFTISCLELNCNNK